MSIFGRFQRKKRKPREEEDEAPAPRADETAPGVRAMKDLWQIQAKKPVERVQGEVVTDIYATPRPNGVPRRRHPQHPRPPPEDFTPPY